MAQVITGRDFYHRTDSVKTHCTWVGGGKEIDVDTSV